MQKYFDWEKNHRTEDNARTERNAMELDCPSDVFFVLKRGFFSIVCSGLRGEHNFLIFPLTFDMFHVQEGIRAASQVRWW